MDGPAVLELRNVEAAYGAIRALHGLSLTLGPGEVVALLGPNGAGKTTTLRVISGLLRPVRGRVLYRGQEITGRPPAAIARLGIIQCPEGRQIFKNLTVWENLILGGYRLRDPVRERRNLERALSLFPMLKERLRHPAGLLSGGQQQMLAIARALMADPEVLLLDEPSLGLAPRVVEEVFEALAQLKAQGLTMLIVEQNAERALELADRAYVLEAGRLVLADAADRLRENPDLIRIYLGR
ncbi:High-affinity branched-chain amino acid transport ATP-binding protein LivF [Candidatus Thermoflexus japonica]|uniref:High-affinity branched-chain amino acid transport ATP-binding protein LivF n=1 Tax=Candidatus Thermoflexus japonica TaxID=2035417 RepID=A0A2H5Y6F2_9CHLR|nr:High-affinity branched-chain amino acid transport ATP-binding protein LivF [Candidatus Thermoflexus japonica]